MSDNKHDSQEDEDDLSYPIPDGAYDGKELIDVMKEIANPTPKEKHD